MENPKEARKEEKQQKKTHNKIIKRNLKRKSFSLKSFLFFLTHWCCFMLFYVLWDPTCVLQVHINVELSFLCLLLCCVLENVFHTFFLGNLRTFIYTIYEKIAKKCECCGMSSVIFLRDLKHSFTIPGINITNFVYHNLTPLPLIPTFSSVFGLTTL